MKRLVIILLAAVFLTVFATSVTAQITETDIFGVEIGQATGYEFGNDNIVTSQILGLHYGMTDEMELGLVFFSGDGTANWQQTNLVRMSYYFEEQFGFNLSVGNSGGNVAGGLGVFSSPIRRTFEDTLTTSLRLSLDYLNTDFTSVAPTDGILSLGVSGRISF